MFGLSVRLVGSRHPSCSVLSPSQARALSRLAAWSQPRPTQNALPRPSPVPSPILRLSKVHNFVVLRHASTSSFPDALSVNVISRLETLADADPLDVEAQLRLFRMLHNQERPAAWNVIISRWERMCELHPSSPLLASDEAFQYYTLALVKSLRSADVEKSVEHREKLLKAQVVSSPSIESKDSTGESSSLSSQSQNPSHSTSFSNEAGVSRSQQIAQSVVAAVQSSSPPPIPPPASSAQVPLGANPLTGLGSGSATSPIFVSIAESRGEFWKKVIRNVSLFAIGGFFVLVGLSLFLENTNLLKTGPRASEFEPTKGNTVKFSDVHGVDEVKEELKDVVDFLKDPAAFSSLGGKLPKGILLTGPPGTGKTMLARAVAGEAGVPFLFASGSEFEEIFVGVGAKRVRELFAAARKKQPAIIFIDELDAIGGKRNNREQQHMKQTLNQLLVEMDGFLQSEGVIVLAATNFPESLDQALIRPGRFDREIAVPLPDVRGRVQILNHFMKDVVSATTVDSMILARGTAGFSGAELQNMVNQAAIQASKEGAKHVELKHYEWAKDRILMGAERKTHYIEPKDKECTAYHEGGHALVALYTEGALPLHKVTCVTRGHALGLTQFLPENDMVSVTRKQYQARIDVLMGGRVAEGLIYGSENISSGASSDIRGATSVASSMVRQWGFSEKVGPVFHNDNDSTISPQKREIIESEIQRMIVEGENRARKLLVEKEDELHKLAKALVEYETLDLEEVKKVIKGEPIRSIEERLLEVAQPSDSPPPESTPISEPNHQPIATVS